MLFWVAYILYVFIPLLVLPFAESARLTRMRIKRVIGFPLTGLLMVSIAVSVFTALSAAYMRSPGGLLKVVLIAVPPLLCLLLLPAATALGRRMGTAALKAPSGPLTFLMEPMGEAQEPRQRPAA